VGFLKKIEKKIDVLDEKTSAFRRRLRFVKLLNMLITIYHKYTKTNFVLA